MMTPISLKIIELEILSSRKMLHKLYVPVIVLIAKKNITYIISEVIKNTCFRFSQMT